MRLDLFLKASRICLRRVVAQKLCDAGLVFLNGVPAKSAHPIRVGDEIEIRRRDKVTLIRVLAIPAGKQVAKKEALVLYEVLSEKKLDVLDM